jgi:hypothetical protein
MADEPEMIDEPLTRKTPRPPPSRPGEGEQAERGGEH